MAIALSIISIIISLGALALSFVLMLRVSDLADKIKESNNNGK